MTGWTDGLPLWALLLVFAASGALVIVAGTALARAGDEIATRTGMSGLFVGVALTSVATSLPEVVASASAAVADAPDLVVSDLFGSSMANMAIFAIIDLTSRRSLWPAVDLGHARVASMAMALTAVALLAVVTPTTGHLGWVGLDSIFIGLVYVAALAWIRRARTSAALTAGVTGLPVATGWSEAEAEEGARLEVGLSGPAVRFGVATALVFVSAPTAAVSAKGIADVSGVGEGFVGVTLLAVVTSLPELVASLAAVRIGAFDIAVGNLFGSNAFNMAVLLISDAAYTRGPLLSAVDPKVQMAAGVGAILLMAMALAAIVHGEETRIGRFEPDAVALLGAYVLLTLLIFATSA